MRRQIPMAAIFGLSVALTLGGCAGPGKTSGKPDLVPVPQILSFDPANFSFCKRDSEGKLGVTVRNQGDAESPSAKVVVTFSPGGQSPEQDTGLISPSDTVDLKFDIPAGCFNPDCGFTISVDPGTQIDESEEGNNVGSGTCIG